MSREPFKSEFRIRIRGAKCVYCGDLATTEDHFPPRISTCRGYLLPACRECNNAAGTLFASDFEERCNHVKEFIRRRYKKVLETPDWSNSEINQLGRGLRSSARKWQSEKDKAQQRISWSVSAYIASIDHRNVFIPINEDGAFSTWNEREFIRLIDEIDERPKQFNYARRAG